MDQHDTSLTRPLGSQNIAYSLPFQPRAGLEWRISVTSCCRQAICRAERRQQNIMALIFSYHTFLSMSSEFHQLSEKVALLAALTQSLRRENADLRLHLSTLTGENAELVQRMELVHLRVTALLERLPATESRSPDASAIDEEETA